MTSAGTWCRRPPARTRQRTRARPSTTRTTRMTRRRRSAPTAAVGGGTTPAGLLATTTTPGGAVESIGYYSDGDVASITDPACEVTKYSYDPLGRAHAQQVVSGPHPG